MNLNCYDKEAILIGLVMRYSQELVPVLFPTLTPDKFIYSRNGKLGIFEHRDIWRAIEKTYLVDRNTVNIPNVLANVYDTSDDVRLYLQAWTDIVQQRYHLYEPDVKTVKQLAEDVDKAGNAYLVMVRAGKLAEGLADQETFEKKVKSIQDIDAWTNDNLSEFRNSFKASTGGLQHISVGAGNVREIWERKRRGEQMTFLPSGMPSMVGGGLFAAGNLSIIHGLSGGGKSAIVHQSDLGIAIGLKTLDIPGCVAIYTLEMKQERLIERCAALLAGFDVTQLDRLEQTYSDEDYERLTKWLDFCATLPIYIDQTNMLTTSAMQYATEGLHVSEAGPVRKCSMDYLELFGDDGAENKEQNLDTIIHRHLDIARVTGANVTAISQSTYAGETKTIYPAGPRGTRYSRAIQHAGDDVIEVWNPVYMKAAGMSYAKLDGISDYQVSLLVQKCRYGSLGSFPLNWDPTCTQYKDPLVNSNLVFEHLKEITEEINGTSASVPDICDTDWGEDF